MSWRKHGRRLARLGWAVGLVAVSAVNLDAGTAAARVEVSGVSASPRDRRDVVSAAALGAVPAYESAGHVDR